MIAFDAFVLFDPSPIEAYLRRYLGDSSPSFLQTWRARQFEYTWWLTCAGKYLDFWDLTLRSLHYANHKAPFALPPDALRGVAETFYRLPAWPDAAPALERLEHNGFRVALLSNFTPQMLQRCLQFSGLERENRNALSADTVRSFKPSPTVYRMVMDHFSVTKKDVFFVAFAPWDALGASWFGYETIWLNRMSQPQDALDPQLRQLPSLTTLADLLTPNANAESK